MTNIEIIIPAAIFSSRETYLAYRREWKVSYKALSKLIRGQKLEIKAQHRSGDSAYYGPLWESQGLATLALAGLAEAKLEAKRQYEAEKAGGDAVEAA